MSATTHVLIEFLSKIESEGEASLTVQKIWGAIHVCNEYAHKSIQHIHPREESIFQGGRGHPRRNPDDTHLQGRSEPGYEECSLAGMTRGLGSQGKQDK